VSLSIIKALTVLVRQNISKIINGVHGNFSFQLYLQR